MPGYHCCMVGIYCIYPDPNGLNVGEAVYKWRIKLNIRNRLHHLHVRSYETPNGCMYTCTSMFKHLMYKCFVPQVKNGVRLLGRITAYDGQHTCFTIQYKLHQYCLGRDTCLSLVATLHLEHCKCTWLYIFRISRMFSFLKKQCFSNLQNYQ